MSQGRRDTFGGGAAKSVSCQHRGSGFQCIIFIKAIIIYFSKKREEGEREDWSVEHFSGSDEEIKHKGEK